MNGIHEFITEASNSKAVGAVILNFILTIVFFGIMLILSAFEGGFVITLAVLMTISGIVSLIFFFISLARLYDDVV